MPLRKLGIGTYVAASPNSPNADAPPNKNPYHPLATATLKTPVFDVVHMFSERSISAVPIIDENGIVVNLYETVDVIVSIWLMCFPPRICVKTSQTLLRLGAYQSLDLTISEALNERSPDFPGVIICNHTEGFPDAGRRYCVWENGLLKAELSLGSPDSQAMPFKVMSLTAPSLHLRQRL